MHESIQVTDPEAIEHCLGRTKLNIIKVDLEKLCIITGSERVCNNNPGNATKFAKCSTEGGYCWQEVNNVSIPRW